MNLDSLSTDPMKVAAVADWPVPCCLRDVRSFPGLVFLLPQVCGELLGDRHSSARVHPKECSFLLDQRFQESFETLKEKVEVLPMLALPRVVGDFVLDTDASNTLSGQS